MKQSRARHALAGVLAGVLAGGTTAVALVPGADATAQTAQRATTAAPAAAGARAFGLTADGSLVAFELRRPGRLEQVGRIRGTDGTRLVGIDVRPANGRLYAVGRAGGIFTINPRTARATRVATLDVALSGGHFGVDVNPAADALRIVSNNGQNLRHVFDGDVTTADAPLNVPDTTPRVRGVVGAAYTNNDRDDATGTALYDLDATSDSIALQVPANAGIVTNQGPLGRNTSTKSGFDILSSNKNGRTVGNVGYATLGSKKGYALYTVDLTSGRATRVGAFDRLVVDLAVVH